MQILKFFSPLRQLVTSCVIVWMAIALTLTGLPVAPAQAATATSPALEKVGESFVAAAVKQVGPAVVRIDTERTVTRRGVDRQSAHLRRIHAKNDYGGRVLVLSLMPVALS